MSFDTEHAPFTEYEKILPVTCVSFAYENGDPAGLIHARDPDARAIVADWLTHHVSVGAQIAHDMAEVCYEWPDLIPLVWQAYAEGRVRDLIQCQRLIAIAAGDYLPNTAGNLDELAQLYGHPPLDKDPAVRLSYGPLRDVPLDQWSERQRTYPVDDARAGLHVALAQPLPVDWANAARADWCCVLMGAWGVRTDLARVAKLRTYCREQLDRCIALLTRGAPLRRLDKSKKWVAAWGQDGYSEEELLAAAPLHPNPKQATGYSVYDKVVRARMAATGATRPTKGGAICCDAEALAASGDPVLESLAKYNSFQKRLGACDILARGELHCWFKPVQENNQTSCSTPYNLQNPPTNGGERECIIPRPGMCFIDADVNLFHMHAFAQVCLEIVERSDMADVLNDFARGVGQKPHVVTGAALAGIPIEQFEPKGKHGHFYGMAKRYNFALLADAGYKRVAATCSKEGVHLNEGDFHAAKNAWLARYPEARMYFNYIQSLGDGATITELFTGRVRGGCSYTDAANGFFSALANSGLKAAWFQVAWECYDPSQGSVLLGDRPVDVIHDQLLIETPLGPGAHDHAMRVKEIIEEELAKFMPDVPPTTDPCLASCWSKGAEAVYEKERLIVWSPG